MDGRRVRPAALVVLAAIAGLGAAFAAVSQGHPPVRVDTARLPPLDIARFGRPPLRPSTVAAALEHGMKFRDRPSIGSGLSWIGGHEFVGVTATGVPRIVAAEEQGSTTTAGPAEIHPPLYRMWMHAGFMYYFVITRLG